MLGRVWSPGRGLRAELGWDRGMRVRIDACGGGLDLACGVGGLRRGRLYIRGEVRRAYWWIGCRMGLSGDRPSRGRRVGGLVNDGGWCRMGKLIRFHRGGERGGARGMRGGFGEGVRLTTGLYTK